MSNCNCEDYDPGPSYDSGIRNSSSNNDSEARCQTNHTSSPPCYNNHSRHEVDPHSPPPSYAEAISHASNHDSTNTQDRRNAFNTSTSRENENRVVSYQVQTSIDDRSWPNHYRIETEASSNEDCCYDKGFEDCMVLFIYVTLVSCAVFLLFKMFIQIINTN